MIAGDCSTVAVMAWAKLNASLGRVLNPGPIFTKRRQ